MGTKNPGVKVPAKKKRGAKKGGRPAFQPTEDQRTLVKVGCVAGFTEEQIAQLISFPHGIDPKTLRKYFAQELATGADAMNVKVVANLWKHATGDGKGAVIAAIFWLKTRLGWREKDGIKVTVPAGSEAEDGAPGEAGTVQFTLKIGDAGDSAKED